ncbi:lantibiotic dehydratase [Actinomadura montaniterrae]|uniref:Lantibiotic dehydratase n=1 Tax=Actinomadura montaniterrae TaxID=1803903 RepID=A0A6L3W9W2_9ACTN|nr:lantibiotic dehydratase [Actinomadura montaniterrae]
MGSGDGRALYRCDGPGLVRAVRHVEVAVPDWPDLTGSSSAHVRDWCAWLREVWAVEAVAEAIEHASPDLAREVTAVRSAKAPSARRVRRATLSVGRYLVRMTGRATPFGLFAGVAPMSTGPRLSVRWGTGHRAIARASGPWLADVIARLESCAQLVERLPVMANNLCRQRGERLVVPQLRAPGDQRRAVLSEVSVRNTAAVQLVVSVASGAPVLYRELAEKVSAEYSDATPSAVDGLLLDLIQQRVLISGLHAPSTVMNALGHLVDQLDAVDAADLPQVADQVRRLKEISRELERHNRAASVEEARTGRTALAERMTTLSGSPRPLAVDLRLDCELALPPQIEREAEVAASALARLTAHPFGTEAWQRYHARFFERYGVGTLVPVLELVNPGVGLGFPDGYPGSPGEQRSPLSRRDERLTELAQTAALDGQREVVLDDASIAGIAGSDETRARWPADLEICFRILAASKNAIERGAFDLQVVTVSRGIDTMVGRFVDLIWPSGREPTRGETADEALPVQLSFAPLSLRAADVTRVPELLPSVLSLGEHRQPGRTDVRLEDLAVGCDDERLYLASLSRRRRVSLRLPHALDLRTATPPLARFLLEVGRAQNAVVTGFNWGSARSLPFLPQIRHRRAILSPARWTLDTSEFAEGDVPWRDSFEGWRTRRQLPKHVALADGDQRLWLDLDHEGHIQLLQAHQQRGGRTVLEEASGSEAFGWFGGRPHEIVLPLRRSGSAPRRSMSSGIAACVSTREDGYLPGASRWLYIKLYGDPSRQNEILAERLPELWSRWEEDPTWWFIRYRAPEPQLRLRVALPDARDFGTAARHVSNWAADLRKDGLVRDLQFAVHYPERGRWGDGDTMRSAEAVFAADSRAVCVQLREARQLHPQALVAAQFVAMAAAFHGSARLGMRWLIEYANAEEVVSAPRDVLTESVRLADPMDSWSALRAEPGGEAIVRAWAERDHALANYRSFVADEPSISMNSVASSLLHAHHMRAVGIGPDHESTCLRLARAAALRWQARAQRSER